MELAAVGRSHDNVMKLSGVALETGGDYIHRTDGRWSGIRGTLTSFGHLNTIRRKEMRKRRWQEVHHGVKN